MMMMTKMMMLMMMIIWRWPCLALSCLAVACLSLASLGFLCPVLVWVPPPPPPFRLQAVPDTDGRYQPWERAYRKPRCDCFAIPVARRSSLGLSLVARRSSGSSLDYIWKSFRLHLEVIWTTFGTRLDYIWKPFRLHLDVI